MLSIEIERKFLIAMPSAQILEKHATTKKEILQTYLFSENKETARIRKITESGKISYVKTVKSRISDLSHFEEEYEISEKDYEKELKNRDLSKNVIEKSRYCIEFEKHILEIDIYSFWTDRAILEIELSCEDESFEIPKYIKVIKEVSADKRYKNTNLASEIPLDIIQ